MNSTERERECERERERERERRRGRKGGVDWAAIGPQLDGHRRELLVWRHQTSRVLNVLKTFGGGGGGGGGGRRFFSRGTFLFFATSQRCNAAASSKLFSCVLSIFAAKNPKASAIQQLHSPNNSNNRSNLNI